MNQNGMVVKSVCVNVYGVEQVEGWVYLSKGVEGVL